MQRSIRQDENGFYVILPSNSDPDVHPDNAASNFRVNYQNPIRFDQPKEWKVAFAEMTYYHSPYTISKQQGFEYDATFDLRVQTTYYGEKKSYNTRTFEYKSNHSKYCNNRRYGKRF